MCLEEMAAAVVSRRVVTKPQPRGHRAGTGKPLRKEPGDGEYEVAPREGPGMEVVGKNPKEALHVEMNKRSVRDGSGESTRTAQVLEGTKHWQSRGTKWWGHRTRRLRHHDDWRREKRPRLVLERHIHDVLGHCGRMLRRST